MDACCYESSPETQTCFPTLLTRRVIVPAETGGFCPQDVVRRHERRESQRQTKAPPTFCLQTESHATFVYNNCCGSFLVAWLQINGNLLTVISPTGQTCSDLW